MIFQLKRLFERIGDRKELDIVVPLEELGNANADGYSPSFNAPVSLKGVIINRAGMVSLSYTADYSLRLTCDRCLDEYVRDFCREFEHVLVLREDDVLSGDEAVCPSGELDITALAVSDMLAELPTRNLCRDGCKGLCPECGANLNRGECGCAAAV